MEESIEIIPPMSSQPTKVGVGGSGGSNVVVDLSPRSMSMAMKRNELRSNGLTDDQVDLILLQNEASDPSSLAGGFTGKQTWSRYLVTNYLEKWKWYNPNKDDPDAPKLAKGWAYFEYFTLPRRFLEKVGEHHIRAPPGENSSNTKLYSVFGTPMESLSDWGIGMVMYFNSLYAVIVIFILAGCLNVANMMYYESDNYDPNRMSLTKDNLLSMWQLLQFSAICTDREWVVCAEGCKENVEWWSNTFTNSYYGTAIDPVTQNEVTLISRTTCTPAELNTGMINYGTLMLLILCMSVYNWYLSKKEVRFDEDNTTAADYSLVVHNPPGSAVDPDEWRDFFNIFSNKGVTLVTVALNNEELLQKLVQRRNDIKALKGRLRKKVEGNLDNEESIHEVDEAVANAKRARESEEKGCVSKCMGFIFTPILRALGFAQTEEMIWERIKETTEDIRELQKKEYQAAAIYVTFETEGGQRNAMAALKASETEVRTNTRVNIAEEALFRGTVLRIEEASEPSAVRWRDLQYRRRSIYLRLLIMFGITLGLVFLSAFVLQLSRLKVNTMLFSIILSTFNSLIPIVVRILVTYEKHYDEGAVQASLYLKITFFRWVNTAIITRIITPLLVTVGQESIDLINTINALMISEMFVSPILRYLDVFVVLNRHFFAPRAKTEEELFACFRGGWYNLSERFTDFTKVLLLCIFYSAFYPLMYFLGAAILFLQYWMDKFLLLRSWQKAPHFGTRTAKFSRIYFTSAAILLGAISSGYAYASSPYTMLCSCDVNNKECTMPVGTQEYTIQKLSGGDPEIVQASVEPFYFCDMDDIGFPPVAKVQGSNKWMTDGQERLTRIYGWTCLALLIGYIVLVLGGNITRAVLSIVRPVYKPKGLNQHKDFSSGIGFESFGFIPQLDIPGFHFPLLVCNIDNIDVRLIGWKDPNIQKGGDPHRNYDDHNLMFDVPHETLHRSRNVAADESTTSSIVGKTRPIFSVVKHYPPKWELERRAAEKEQK